MVDNIPISAIGLSGAPWNVSTCLCPECQGRGEWYTRYDDDGEIIDTLDTLEYRQLSLKERKEYEKHLCPLCDGVGEIDENRYRNYYL